MDKKNTMLLTVIAVATLLVAVVGATFAYFSVSVTKSGTQTTTVTGKTGKIPTITLTNQTNTMNLKVSSTDMAIPSGQNPTDIPYYAITGECPDTAVNCRATTEGATSKVTTAQVAVTNGDTNVSYTCTGKIKVSVDTTANTMGAALQAGDVKVKLYGLSTAVTSDTTGTDIDLYTIAQDTNHYKTYDLSNFTIEGNGTRTIQASVRLINKVKGADDAGIQNHLADKTLTVTIEPVDIACTINPA